MGWIHLPSVPEGDQALDRSREVRAGSCLGLSGANKKIWGHTGRPYSVTSPPQAVAALVMPEGAPQNTLLRQEAGSALMLTPSKTFPISLASGNEQR